MLWIGIGGVVLAAGVWAAFQYASYPDRWRARVRAEFARQPLAAERILTEADLTRLPAPVRTYLRYAGAVGKPVVQNCRVVMDADMFREPQGAPMRSRSVQYNFFGDPARFFLMRAVMGGLPVAALHVYAEAKATFQVRIASLLNVVDLRGDQLSRAETVTVLNDLCIFTPGALADPRLAWRELDPLTAEVTLANGPYAVKARLIFNAAGELVNFESDDRSALQNDGSLRQAPWSTPLRDYREFEGRRVASRGEAVWHYPEGDFTYGRFEIREVRHNLSGPEAGD